jgi:hypothetical protein
MAEDVFKAKGPLKSSKPSAGGGSTLEYPVIGIVKDNIDPTRSGKLRVQLEGATNGQSDNSEGWTTVQYLSTFFGMVKPTAGSTGNGDYVSNPSAYGQWQSPPDIGTKVLCIFAEGDPSRGYYIGCVLEPEALQMIPAIGTSDIVVPNEGEAQGLAGATRLPVTSINTNNKSQSDSNDYLDAPKPIHSYTASIMSQQGIIRDPIRGPISSSASREAVSRVGWGVATPGRPIMEGGYTDENLPKNLNSKNQEQLKVIARRGGHSIVMDDGDIIGRDQLIRIRTALGHQIMMSDDGQTLMILHSNGQSYVELGKEGTVDIFSTNSFNVRTHGDINFHADQHINFHANENMNIQAKNIHINSEEDFKLRSGKKLQLYSVEDFTVKSLGAAAIKSDGQASINSSGVTYINGSKINLNTGKSSVNPPKVPTITLISQTDTLYDEQKGFLAAPGKLLTVTTRTPAHYPWSNAGQGVDVKSTLDATKSLPSIPSSSVQKANREGIASGATPPAIATVASAPDTKAISKSMDKTVTNAVIGSVATGAALGPAKAAVSSGSAIVSTLNSVKTVAVGAFAQSPSQMVSAGILKPGADRLINGLAQKAGATVEKIMPNQLFTGKPGAKDLSSFVKDTTAQTTAVINNMQKAQTNLGNAGVLTGKEAATQVAGLVTAGATIGVNATINAVKSVSGVASSIQNTASNVISAIGSGASAAGLANKLGGLGGISNSIKALGKGLGNVDTDGQSLNDLLESVKGPAGAAFASIRDSLKPLQAGIPQNLTEIAKTAAATVAGIASSESGIFGSGNELLKNVVNQKNVTSITDLNELIDNNTAAGIAGSFKQAKTQLGAIGDQLSSQGSLLANITGGITDDLLAQFGGNAVSTVTSLTKALNNTPNLINSMPNNLGSPINPMNTLNNIFNDINTDVTGVRNIIPLVPSNTEDAINNINNAIKDISGISGAAAAITKGNMTELSNAANAIQSGASAAIASGLASGINNLPGGLKSVSAVMNNSLGAVNSLPGTEMLGDMMKNLQNSAINGIGNTVNSITSSINSKLGGALSKEGGLTSLIASALPMGKAAGLLSGLSALGAGGPAKIKLPTNSFNTFDRAGLDSQIKSILSNPKIPLPNLVGEIKEGVVNQLEQLIQKNKEAFSVFDELENWEQKIKEAKDRLYEAESNLPAGDRGIASAQGLLDSIMKDPELIALRKKAESFGENVVDDMESLITSASQNTTMLNSATLGNITDTIRSSASEVIQQATTDVTKTTVMSVNGQGSTAITQLQYKSSSQADINNSIAGIVGPTDNT